MELVTRPLRERPCTPAPADPLEVRAVYVGMTGDPRQLWRFSTRRERAERVGRERPLAWGTPGTATIATAELLLRGALRRPPEPCAAEGLSALLASIPGEQDFTLTDAEVRAWYLAWRLGITP